MTDITNIVNEFREYDSSLDVVTSEQVGSDMIYRKFVKNVTEAKTFNYHSDYWGYADSYQADNIEFMQAIKPYINKKVIIDGIECKLLGMLIDKQYNSLNHTDILVEI